MPPPDARASLSKYGFSDTEKTYIFPERAFGVDDILTGKVAG